MAYVIMAAEEGEQQQQQQETPGDAPEPSVEPTILTPPETDENARPQTRGGDGVPRPTHLVCYRTDNACRKKLSIFRPRQSFAQKNSAEFLFARHA